MSVTFSVKEYNQCKCQYTDTMCDECYARMLNCANSNAYELCGLLGIPFEYGHMRAKELQHKIKHVLSTDFSDCGEQGYREANFIYGGRREGYLTEKLQTLLRMCERAGELGSITWG